MGPDNMRVGGVMGPVCVGVVGGVMGIPVNMCVGGVGNLMGLL